MSGKVSWFKDAAAVIREIASKPVFPGKPEPILDVLDDLSNKLLGECLNGSALGSDECPPCRAFRTEAAEKQAAEDRSVRSGLEAKVASLVASRDDLTSAVEDLSAQVVEAERDRDEAAKEAAEAAKVAEVAKSDAAYAAQERASAQRQAADYKSQVDDLSKRLSAALAEADRVDALVKQIVGGSN